MKTYFSIVTFSVLILLAFTLPAKSQESNYTYRANYFGFDATEWEKISGWYERSQARAEILMKNGSGINGQIVFIDNNKVLLYPGYDIIIDPDLASFFIKIDINEISKIKVKRNTKNYEAMVLAGLAGGATFTMGGSILLWADASVLTVAPFTLVGAAAGGFLGKTIQQFPRRYNFGEGDNNNEQYLSSLKKWAVFEDSIYYYKDFRDLVDNSKLVARSFPEKHIKVTAAIGPIINGNTFATNIEEVMDPQYPLVIGEDRGFSPSVLFSASYKFGRKFHAGAGFLRNYIPGSYNYELSDTVNYNVNPRKITGFKIFAEYAPVTTDRYLSSRLEILLGAGIIFGKSDLAVSWTYYDSEQYAEFGYGEMNSGEISLKGLSGHLLINYYLSPNISISAGLEENLFQNINIPAVNELDFIDGSPSINIEIPEYHINYSSLQLKTGLNFYF